MARAKASVLKAPSTKTDKKHKKKTQAAKKKVDLFDIESAPRTIFPTSGLKRVSIKQGFMNSNKDGIIELRKAILIKVLKLSIAYSNITLSRGRVTVKDSDVRKAARQLYG